MKFVIGACIVAVAIAVGGLILDHLGMIPPAGIFPILLGAGLLLHMAGEAI